MTPRQMHKLLQLPKYENPKTSEPEEVDPIPPSSPFALLEAHRQRFLDHLRRAKNKDLAYMELQMYNFGFLLLDRCRAAGHFIYHKKNLPPLDLFKTIPSLYEEAIRLRLISPERSDYAIDNRRFAMAKEGAILRKYYHKRGLPAVFRSKTTQLFHVEHLRDMNLYSIRIDPTRKADRAMYAGIYPTEEAARRTAQAISDKLHRGADIDEFLLRRPIETVHMFEFFESLAPSESLQVTRSKYAYLRDFDREGWVGPFKHVPEARLMRNAILCSGNWDPYFEIATSTRPGA